MNQKFIDILKPKILSFIQNANEDDCKLVLGKNYSTGFHEFIQKIRGKQDGEKINFVCQFPDQATILPCYAFILGNVNSQFTQQTFNYEDEELSRLKKEDQDKLLHLLQTVEGKDKETFHYKSWISQSSIIISTYSNNKDATSWLMTLMDFIIKMSAEQFELKGFMQVSTSQTDLRIQQELFPLKVPTRVMTVNFTFEQHMPIRDFVERHVVGDFDTKYQL